MHKLDIPYLRSRFAYDRTSGHVIYACRPITCFRDKRFNERFGGKRACYEKQDSRGRVELSVMDGKRGYVASRIIWALVYDQDPYPMQIDHEDGDQLNNSIENLRLATGQQNCQNKGKQKNNTSGYRGVFSRNGFFETSVKLPDGRRVWKGGFMRAEDAALARDHLAKHGHGEFFRSSIATILAAARSS